MDRAVADRAIHPFLVVTDPRQLIAYDEPKAVMLSGPSRF